LCGRGKLVARNNLGDTLEICHTNHTSHGKPVMNVFSQKLFALLHDPLLKALYRNKSRKGPWEQFFDDETNNELNAWWNRGGITADHIAAASDRMTLRSGNEYFVNAELRDGITYSEVRHPISGQSKVFSFNAAFTDVRLSELENSVLPNGRMNAWDIEKKFWWCWRFYPEMLAKAPELQEADVLILPAETRIPDCPTHTHNSVASAIAGAMFTENGEQGKPYLVMFTFSPVQEFIKSSRKLLDFWSGSYMLHYLSAKLCWIITPSLWGQEIIDAWIVKKYSDFDQDFQELDKFFRQLPDLESGLTPAERFNKKQSISLSTAGFPNVIVALVPGKAAADKLGQELRDHLLKTWKEIGKKIASNIRGTVISRLGSDEKKRENLWNELTEDLREILTDDTKDRLKRQFHNWCNAASWEWGKLWDAQLDNTWESYWTALPLGDPDQPLKMARSSTQFQTWLTALQDLSQVRGDLPTNAEKHVYPTLNVGTWWGSLQQRLGQNIQAVKNTRTWKIPAAPGERSSLSGLYSAVHPNLNYNGTFREGGGLPTSSQTVFWRLMSKAYPGLFNGSERLNALDLTKRLAWVYGGVAEDLGVQIQTTSEDKDSKENYEKWIRFPNLSSIAAAHFAAYYPQRVKEYWDNLAQAVKNERGLEFSSEHVSAFYARTQQPFYIDKVDETLDAALGKKHNGAMFSAKWLADDMGLQGEAVGILRGLVESAHKKSGFAGGSPADWWVLVLADGDSMGKYVTGRRLKYYHEYLPEKIVALLRNESENWVKLVDKTKKRMGPATHVGLNRALLDFSNRLVPYLTEKRCCGRVIYSGGDDVMAALPLEDMPEFLRSLRAAWCGSEDPQKEFTAEGGYWTPKSDKQGLPRRAYFTMGEGATLSAGIVIAHKSVPLPTVLENIWTAEKERAKKLPDKDGLCFRVIYGSGNVLEALLKGDQLDSWWEFMHLAQQTDFSPSLHRLCEELPRHTEITADLNLIAKAAKVILERRDRSEETHFSDASAKLVDWLNNWEKWAWEKQPLSSKRGSNKPSESELEDLLEPPPLGTELKDLVAILRFSAFWLDRSAQRKAWAKSHSSQEV
jgi:CRISPR-associated protein Cmr2